MGTSTIGHLNLGDGLRLPLDAVTQTFAVLAKRGVGKRLSLDTPLPTPTGWTTMGDVAIGDEVLDERGRPCRVTYLSPIALGDSYRVTFNDGTEILADAEHLWLTHDRGRPSARVNVERSSGEPRLVGGASRPQNMPRANVDPLVRSTAEIAATLRSGRERNHAVRNTRPLDLPDMMLPVDPYVLGAWLGDGTSSHGIITVGRGDEALLDEFRAVGYEVRAYRRQPGRAPMYGIPRLRVALRSLGVLNNKHVPATYLRASAAQRLALLQGLMDTDGGWTGSNAEIALTDERLADAVHELIVSLGMSARRSKRTARLNGVDHGVSHRIRFSPTMQVFRLPRKAARYRPDATQQQRRTHRYIDAVDPIPSVPMRCIAVDSPSRLYLAGRSMVPTHNTYTGSVLAEEMIEAGQQVVAVDPVGVWWGLRSSADGEHAGYPIVILGGDHADLPLEPDAGELVADLIIDEGLSLVLDLSLLRKGEQRRFMVGFAEALYHRNRRPLHLIVDEADAYAPQRPPKGDGPRLLGAMEDLVRRGRARGIGVTLITQRAAVLNKDVLTQAEVLVALRMVGPQDRKAIDDWVSQHGTAEQRDELLASLASLPVGTAWFWSPGWLGEFRRVAVRRRRTYDSSATPEVGAQAVTPRGFADVDLNEVRERMTAIVERAEAEDPKRLRARIVELEADLEAARRDVPEPTVERVEVPVPNETAVAELRAAVEGLRDVRDLVAGPLDAVVRAATRLDADLQQVEASIRSADVQRERARAAAADARRAVQQTRPASDCDVHLRAGARRMLRELARYHPDGLSRVQLGSLAGIAHTGGTFSTYLGDLRRAGYITEDGETITATPTGVAAAGVRPGPSRHSRGSRAALVQTTARRRAANA